MRPIWWSPVLLLLLTVLATSVPAQEASSEEAQQLQAAQRFLTVLEKNPRRGTALDKVYGHHVEFGTLESFLKTLRDRAAKDDGSGALAMLIGLIEYQRGNDANAIDSFSKAEQLRPKDPLASYYAGQSKVRMGDFAGAIEAMERALTKNPQRSDQLEIFQQLGRLHGRSQKTEEAMKVWRRLEELFPTDERVVEQIASTLAEENQFAEALPRYEKLVTMTKDDYRKVSFAVAAAELTIKQGKKEDGLARMESLLANLKPDGWLYRDVRRRIDDVFLRSGDQDGLVAYYQGWLGKHPEDVEAMARLGRFLSQSARGPEAMIWLDKATQLAPKRVDLRKTYIDLLAEEKKYAEASKQYEQLLNLAPNNPDHLRNWGKLVLRDKDRPETERRDQAFKIWNRMLEANPKDAVAVSQVADLCRQNQMPEAAETLYRRAVELAPGEAQYREYLGEFLHIQKRSDEAKSVWNAIASEGRRNVTNVSRLAEICNSFGFPAEACEEIAQAMQLDAKDFALQLKGAELHSKAGKFDEALKIVDRAEKLAANADERESVLKERIDILQTSQKLEEQSDALEQRLATDTNASALDWYQLARFRESNRQWDAASKAIDQAIAKDSQSVIAWTAAARIAESGGDFGRAAELYRKLTQLDRRSLSEHWTSVSRLEAQMGRKEQALEAAQQLIIAAPSKTENYEFLAQTCFRLGEMEQGLAALRKAMRINPNEPSLIMALAAALVDQMRVDEGIEIYWRAYEKSDNVTDKTTLIGKIAPLYQQLNQTDKLIERLDRERQDEEKRREGTICLAQAWQTLGDVAGARKELEGLLSESTKDTNLLNQLAKLCMEDADMDSAIGYQRQLASIAPGEETEGPLAGMLIRNGMLEEAKDIYVKLIEAEEDPVHQMRSLDSLLSSGNFDTAMRVMEPLMDKKRDDWELLYRHGVCWSNLKNPAEAKTRFNRILALALPHESLGRAAEAKLKQAQDKARSDNLKGIKTTLPIKESALQMLGKAAQVRMATGLIVEEYYSGNQTTTLWTPESYGLARMAALGWLIRFEQEAELTAPKGKVKSPEAKDSSLVDTLKEKANASNANRLAILDWLYAATLKNELSAAFQVARQLAKTGEMEEQRYFLQSLRTRDTSLNSNTRSRSSSNSSQTRTPLNDDDLALMQKCFDTINAKGKEQDLESMYGSNIAYGSDGQAYVLVGGSYQILPGVFRNSGGFASLVTEEYRLAGKTEKVDERIQSQMETAKTSSDWMGVLALLSQEERTKQIPDAFQRWQAAALKDITEKPVVSNRNRNANRQTQTSMPLTTGMNFLQRWIGTLGSEEENDQILQIVDKVMPVALAEARYREKVLAVSPPPTGTSSSTTSSVYNIQTYYGKTSTRVALKFPYPTTELDMSAITLLRQAFDVLQKNGVSKDLTDRIRKGIETAGDDIAFWKWSLASVLWWSEEQDEAMKFVQEIAAARESDLDTQFRLAGLLESRNEFEDALAVVNKVAPRDQNRLQRRELAAIRLAERVGDTDRARQAADRLFGLRLSNDVQMQLAPQMRRLGLDDKADAIMARVERTAGKQVASFASLMNLYQAQGKPENANQMAMTILRRTVSPYAASQNVSNVSPTIRSSQDSQQRTAAIQQLAKSNALKKMQEQLKEKLERAPDSLRTLEQLIEYAMSLNETGEAAKYLKKAIELRPDSNVLRWHLAKQQASSGKPSEACDQYLALLESQPNWLADNFWEIDQTFTQANRKKDLLAKLETMDIRRFGSPWNLINIIENSMMRDAKLVESMIPLMERIYDTFPSYRQNMFNNLGNRPDNLKNERFYELVKRTLLPGPQVMKGSDWSGLEQISLYGDGRVQTQFSQVLDAIKSTPRLASLRQSIQETVDRQPNWLAGQAMLGLIEISTNQSEQGRDRIAKLVDSPKIKQDMPYEACWILGQELAKFTQTEELAYQLFQEADAKETAQQNRQEVQYTPLAALANLAGKRPADRAKVKQKLDDRIRKGNGRDIGYSDPDYEAYQRMQQKLGVGKLYQSLGYPVDTLLTLKDVLEDPSLKGANRFMGSSDYYKQQIDSTLESAQKSLSDAALTESLDSLLANTDKQPLDLMLKMPSLEKVPDRKMQSDLIAVLSKAATKPETKQLVSDRIAKLVEQYPKELMARMLDVLWKLDQEARAEDLIPSMQNLIENAKLEPIAEGRTANSRQRKEAYGIAFLWLPSRQILDKPALSENSDLRRLADQAIEIAIAASARQFSNVEQSMVLLEWSNWLAQQKNWQQAETQWDRILSIAKSKVRQPAPKPQAEGQTVMVPMTGPKGAQVLAVPGNIAPASPVTKAETGNRTPPMTISQFRIAMRVHEMAAMNSRMETAAKALRDALQGGMPVPDPDQAVVDPNRQMVLMSSRNAQAKEDPIEVEVQATLQKSLALWNKSQQAPAELYDALRLFVMPGNRPEEIRLFVDPKALENGRADSMASSLVASAAKSGKLDSLKEEVSARAVNAANQLPKQVLTTLIAIEANDLEAAKTLIDQAVQTADKNTSSSANSMLSILALKGFAVADLKKASAPLMKRLLNRKQSPSDQNNDPYEDQRNGRPLISELAMNFNRFLVETGDEAGVRENLEGALTSRSATYQSYGNDDYGRALQRADLQSLASSAAKLHMPSYVLELLGRSADMENKSRYYFGPMGQDSQGIAWEFAVRYLQGKSAEDRFKAWYDWTMPNANRSTLRFESATAISTSLPTTLINSTNGNNATGALSNPNTPRSNFIELVEAAIELGKMDDLQKDIDKLEKEGMAKSGLLLDLIHIYRKDDSEVSKRLTTRVNKILQKRRENGQQPQGYPYGNESSEKGDDVYALLNEDALTVLAASLKKSGYEKLQRALSLVLRQSPFGSTQPSDELTREVRIESNYWLKSKEVRAGVPEQNPMYLGTDLMFQWLRFPLTGSFTVSWEKLASGIVEQDGVRLMVANGTVSDGSGFFESTPTLLKSEGDRSTAMEVTSDKVRFMIDGQLVTEQPRFGTSPWLAISTGPRSTSWRNLKIEGSPEIPKELALVQDDHMDGWVSAAFNESQRKSRQTKSSDTTRVSRGRNRNFTSADPNRIDWSVENGTLSAKDNGSQGVSPKESWLYYQRPLANGETIHYEFFHESKTKVAHPTIGRLAMMLLPEGVRLHTIVSEERDRVLFDLKPEDTFVDELGKQLTDKIPLKEKDWNTVSMSLRDHRIELSLNGVAVYVRPLDTGLTSQAGFFRYKHQESRIRNVRLTGEWPDKVTPELLSEINAQNEALFIESLDKTLPSLAGVAIANKDWARALALPPERAYEVLMKMVLPPQGLVPRFTYHSVKPDAVPDNSRSMLKLDCVAVELVKLSQKLGQSKALDEAITNYETKFPEAKSALVALRCLNAIESKDEKSATVLLDQLATDLNSDLPAWQRIEDQTPTFVAAWRASSVPALRNASLKVAKQLQALNRDNNRVSTWSERDLLIHGLVGDLMYLLDSSTEGKKLTQWNAFTPSGTPSTIYKRPSQWQAGQDKVHHRAGESLSQLFFQSPLQGKFEITADRTTWGWREVAITYGMHAAEPKHDLTKVRVIGTQGPGEVGEALEIPGFKEKDRASFRIVVDDNQVITYTNGVKVHEETFSGSPSPWLALKADQPGFDAEVENLRITGSPTIPEELDLLAPSGMAAWDGSITGESLASDQNRGGTWQFQPAELTSYGYNRTDKQGSAIHYLRPMLEDGVVEFETWYDSTPQNEQARSTEAHPVLGNCAYVLKSEGVQVHKLATDDSSDRSLLSNNLEPLSPRSKPINLEEKDWNRVRLELKGSTLTISVNDEQVASIEVKELPQDRRIGLFHFGQCSSRVRNMKYRGNWPKTLPTIEQQELAKK